jgi:hypothetical protein
VTLYGKASVQLFQVSEKADFIGSPL